MFISLSRETINLMIQSQKIIRQEFGVNIRLDDDQALPRILMFSRRSGSNELRNYTGKLKELIPEIQINNDVFLQ